SLNRRDYDPERESRPGEDVARNSPPELPPDLLKESDRLRLDLLKAEADRYPAQYRSFIEAYLKSLHGSPSGGSPGSSPPRPPRPPAPARPGAPRPPGAARLR